jgi:hypothetical protein
VATKLLMHVAALLVVAIGTACDGDSPTGTRYNPPILHITCATSGLSPLVCIAEDVCGGYGCAPGVGGDVTARATWSVDHPDIVRVIAPGRLVAVSDGDTVVRAQHATSGGAARAVSVIDGSAPLPTFEIFGTVRDASGPLDGALVTIVDGPLGGRSVTSGVPPPLIPGYAGPFGGTGYYRLLGVPAGAYRLRVTKPGYRTEERDVAVTVGSPSVDITLQAQT